jgi:hypothetical protein
MSDFNLDNLAPYDPDTKRPKAILVDIDGCVALGPTPFSGNSDDYSPNMPVIACVQAMYKDGYKIVYLTGRPESTRKTTFKWLIENVCPFEELYMRPDGSAEKSEVLKYLDFNTHIRSQYNAVFTLENCKEVVQMFRAIGLSSFKVHGDDNNLWKTKRSLNYLSTSRTRSMKS